MLKYLLLLLCSCHLLPAFAWCATGHRVVGQIAYDYLTPTAKHKFAHLNQLLNDDRHHFDLVGATVWLDLFYDQYLLSLRRMHYIDIPFANDGTTLPKISEPNAVTAIEQSTRVLSDSQADLHEQANALRILLHVVGDVHQPLHATTRISAKHEQGDRGGNDFRLGKNEVALNLHSYWDQGGGLLKPHLSLVDVKKLAHEIEDLWACPVADFDAMHWAEEAHDIAINHVYALEERTTPTFDYELKAKELTQKQLAYAGCRLALLLNHLA